MYVFSWADPEWGIGGPEPPSPLKIYKLLYVSLEILV